MLKKVTYEYIKSVFEKEGYILFSKEYKNAHKKLKCICPNGHSYKVSWNKWQQHRRCPICAIQKRTQKSKKTIEFIRFEFEKEGYTLLSKEYINNKTKLVYICPNEHKHSTCWADWSQGRRCFWCGVENKAFKRRLNYNNVKRSFENENYVLLSTKYKNAHEKLECVCPNGHKCLIEWNHWKSGHRCPTCAIINNSGNKHYNWKGGISCEPYCDAWADKEFKEDIKLRDNCECQNPDCWGISKRLCIHHIDYVKKNCNPSNLITLCTSCNVRANRDREYWREFYVSIMLKRGLINVQL